MIVFPKNLRLNIRMIFPFLNKISHGYEAVPSKLLIGLPGYFSFFHSVSLVDFSLLLPF